MVRVKNRYFLIQLQLEKDEIVDGLSQYSLQSAIIETLEQLYGDYAVILQNGVSVKYYSPWTGMAILRASRDHHKCVWAAITLTATLKNRRLAMRVIHCSGTMKLLEKYAIKYNTEQIRNLRQKKIISEKKATMLLEKSSEELCRIDQN